MGAAPRHAKRTLTTMVNEAQHAAASPLSDAGSSCRSSAAHGRRCKRDSANDVAGALWRRYMERLVSKRNGALMGVTALLVLACGGNAPATQKPATAAPVATPAPVA